MLCVLSIASNRFVHFNIIYFDTIMPLHRLSFGTVHKAKWSTKVTDNAADPETSWDVQGARYLNWRSPERQSDGWRRPAATPYKRRRQRRRWYFGPNACHTTTTRGPVLSVLRQFWWNETFRPCRVIKHGLWHHIRLRGSSRTIIPRFISSAMNNCRFIVACTVGLHPHCANIDAASITVYT